MEILAFYALVFIMVLSVAVVGAVFLSSVCCQSLIISKIYRVAFMKSFPWFLAAHFLAFLIISFLTYSLTTVDGSEKFMRGQIWYIVLFLAWLALKSFLDWSILADVIDKAGKNPRILGLPPWLVIQLIPTLYFMIIYCGIVYYGLDFRLDFFVILWSNLL